MALLQDNMRVLSILETIMFGLELTEVIYSVVILAICGGIAGFLAGLLGIGGGIVFVPALYFIFIHAFHISEDLAIILATGTSLMCMIPTSIVAAISQYKRGNTDLQVIKTWAIAMIVGVTVGTLISVNYGGEWLAVLFGCVMIINSINTLFRAKAKPAFFPTVYRFWYCLSFSHARRRRWYFNRTNFKCLLG